MSERTPPRRAPALLEGSLGFNVYRCSLLLRRELIRALAPHGMTPEQWHVLAVLVDAAAPVSQAEIVDLLQKDRPTVTRVLQRMERDGWVVRTPDAADARVVRVAVTAAGRRLHGRIPGLLTAQLDVLWRGLSEERIERLIRDLKHVRRLLGD